MKIFLLGENKLLRGVDTSILRLFKYTLSDWLIGFHVNLPLTASPIRKEEIPFPGLGM